MSHLYLDLCTSGKKHDNLAQGVFEYAEFKKCKNHDVISMVPTQKLKF